MRMALDAGTLRAARTGDLVLCAVFTALIAVGAFIRVPVPVVPFTLQVLFTTLAGLILGGRGGAKSVLCYVALGLLGFPIFTEGGGLGYVLKPTFGYILGFCAGAYITGVIAAGTLSYKRFMAASLAGLGVVYIFGIAWYYVISNFFLDIAVGIWPLFIYGFVLAVPGDIVLCLAASALAMRLIPIARRYRP